MMDKEDLERLLLDLTPGGSEYYGDPERCARWIKDSLAMTGRLAAERNRLRDAADALAVIAAALCQAVDEYTIEVGKVERGESDFADQGELYDRREAVDKALRQYEEVNDGRK